MGGVVAGLALGQLVRELSPEHRFPRRVADVCWYEDCDERKRNA